MAVDSVLCPHCLERGSLPRKRNFFHMPTYVCPACEQRFSYPFSWATWVVSLLLALGAIALLVIGVESGTIAKALAAGSPRGLVMIGVVLVGSIGALFFHRRLRRSVAEAEARAAGRGETGSNAPGLGEDRG